MKDGDFVRISYTGKIASTGAVFETTDEAAARQANIFTPKARYGHKVVALGFGQMIRGLEEAVRTLSPGKQGSFLLPPKKAFGERREDLVRVLPISKFSSQGVSPTPGMMVLLDSVAAKVKSVGAGRVTVDFNHPLAGENVVYSIRLEEVISDTGKKVQALLDSALLEADCKVNGSSLEVKFRNREDTRDQGIMEQAFLASVKAYIPEISEIRQLGEEKKEKGPKPAAQPEAKSVAKPDSKPAPAPPEAKAKPSAPQPEAKKPKARHFRMRLPKQLSKGLKSTTQA